MSIVSSGSLPCGLSCGLAPPSGAVWPGTGSPKGGFAATASLAVAVDPGDTLGLLMEIGALGSHDVGTVRRTREALAPAYDRASDLKDWEQAHTIGVLREALRPGRCGPAQGVPTEIPLAALPWRWPPSPVLRTVSVLAADRGRSSPTISPSQNGGSGSGSCSLTCLVAPSPNPPRPMALTMQPAPAAKPPAAKPSPASTPTGAHPAPIPKEGETNHECHV